MMKKITRRNMHTPLIAGLLVGLLSMLITTGMVFASPSMEEGDPMDHADGQDCRECHLDITESWSHSPHAHAYDDPVFQERWTAMGEPDNCLACHTTNYMSSTGEYSAEGVVCESCHGNPPADHPPQVVPIKADTDYCGSCHTTTLSEWRTTGHAAADVDCMDCHDPHSQKALFEDPDEMCLNCHTEDDMGVYLEDIHVQKDIGCVDCHALVIPPEVPPDDGIVPTGHSFDITPATCVACHTDALHAGFSLPGYENGTNGAEEAAETDDVEEEVVQEEAAREVEVSPEQKIQALETALANRNFTTLFQGGVVGLVLGGSTAWVVARNLRQHPEDEDEEGEDDK